MVSLIYAQKYQELLTRGRSYLEKDPNDASAYELMGQAYHELQNYDTMVWYQEKSLELDKGKTLISCWAHITLGRFYYMKGDNVKAKAELEKSINKKATARMRNFSLTLIRSFGLDPFYDKWHVTETEHIRFHFQDTLGVPEYRNFIQAHENAYTSINKTFEATLPKKLDMYCWNSKDDAKKFLLRPLGYTYAHSCVIHSHNSQTKGHEITHALSFWGWDTHSVYANRLINEGMAVAFDMSMVDKYAQARQAIQNIYIGDIKNIWLSPTHYSEQVLYPIAGAFVHFLKGKSSPEQFKQLIKDQSMANAQIIYGADFDKLMQEFNDLVGIK